MKWLRFIVVASVLAVFAVVTMATQGQAHTSLSGNCSDLGTFDKTFHLTAAKGPWTILAHDEIDSTKSVAADAWIYNGTIPG